MRRRQKSSTLAEPTVGESDSSSESDSRTSKRHNGKSRSKGQERFIEEASGNTDQLKSDIQICGLTSFLLLFLYWLTLHPSVSGGDSDRPEVISISMSNEIPPFEVEVAHPPGYPLFTILSKLSMLLLPINSPAWRVNLLNAILSSIAGGLLQLTVLRLSHCVGASLLTIALFSVNKLTWTWSLSAEVFALNNLFIALLMFIGVELDATTDPRAIVKYVYIGAFVSGLSLTNQHTVAVYVFCLAVWTVLKLRKYKLLKMTIIIKMAAYGLLGLSPYLYLPISSLLGVARWTWGDHRTIGGFLTHFLRREYGTFDLGKDQKGSGFMTALNVYSTHIQRDLCDLTPWLALIGVVVACSWFSRGRSSSLIVYTIMTLLYTALFCWRANLDMSNPLFRGVVERFWMQSDMGVSLLAALGYHTAVRMVTEKFLGAAKISMASVFTTMGAGVLIVLQLKNYSGCDQSSNYIVRDFATNILERVPPNSIILTKGDLPSNSIRYLHLCENMRRDVQVLDVEILSYEWSLPMLKRFYPRINFGGDMWALSNHDYPDGRRSFNFKTFLDNNYKKYPLFACIGMQERDDSWKTYYQLWPFGVCSRIESVKQALDPKRWANRTGGFSDKWTHSFDAFDVTSWERVANDEMWHAKIASAFYMYRQAENTENMTIKASLLEQSYELYFRAIKLNQKPSRMSSSESFPSFWHKNFALVCERLLHVDSPSGIDKIRLCKLSIYHFQQYVHINPRDPDAATINNAVEILQRRLQSFDQLEKVDKILDSSSRRAERLEEMNRAAAASISQSKLSKSSQPPSQ